MYSIFYVHRLITSLFFTVVVETLIIYLLLKFVFKEKHLTGKQIVLAGIFASFATIPYVWFVFPNLMDWPRNVSLIYSELFVFMVEAIFYKIFFKTSWFISLFLSLIANIVSFTLGPILRSYNLWIYW